MRLLYFLDGLLARRLCPLCLAQECEDGTVCPDCWEKLPEIGEHRCRFCGGPTDGFLDICDNCQELDERPWLNGVTAFQYRKDIREIIRRYKYYGAIYLSRFLGHQMSCAWQKYHGLARPEIIVPVPLHWSRLLARGYNQSALLAEKISRELGIPWANLLHRRRQTTKQARLDKSHRQKNLRGAFAVRKSSLVRGRRLLVVDDVFTTGATLTEVTLELLKAGAKEVSLLTAARD